MTDLILLGETDASVRETLTQYLAAEGFRIVVRGSGEELVQAAAELSPAVVVFDLHLPDMSGFEVCRRLRGSEDTGAVPVVVLSARDDETDQVVAFELGADDVLIKPFFPRELVLRIKAILRRSSTQPLAAIGARLQVGPVAVDLDRRCGIVEGEEIGLTHREFELLKALLERPGRVQTRRELLTEIWGTPPSSDSRTVDSHIKRLRNKLGGVGHMIRTVRGLGYSFQ